MGRDRPPSQTDRRGHTTRHGAMEWKEQKQPGEGEDQTTNPQTRIISLPPDLFCSSPFQFSCGFKPPTPPTNSPLRRGLATSTTYRGGGADELSPPTTTSPRTSTPPASSRIFCFAWLPAMGCVCSRRFPEEPPPPPQTLAGAYSARRGRYGPGNFDSGELAIPPPKPPPSHKVTLRSLAYYSAGIPPPSFHDSCMPAAACLPLSPVRPPSPSPPLHRGIELCCCCFEFCQLREEERDVTPGVACAECSTTNQIC